MVSIPSSAYVFSVIFDKVCIVVTEDQLVIGKVVHVSNDMETCLLKDARIIILDNTTNFTPEGITTVVSDIKKFMEFCSSMTTPIEYFAASKIKFILSTNQEIKAFYTNATKNDKTTIKENNKDTRASWRVDTPASTWSY